MPAGSQPFVRAADPADAGQVAANFAHYVATSVATFEEVAPAAADWRRRLAGLTALNLPFLVAQAHGGADGGAAICGFAYASPWRPKPAYRYTVEDTVYLPPGCTGRGASAALHRRLGFAGVGNLPQVGFKFGRWVDTALMQKDLEPTGVAR
jgi:L-amino acid N-acyltransferase YncA